MNAANDNHLVKSLKLRAAWGAFAFWAALFFYFAFIFWPLVFRAMAIEGGF